LKFNSIELKFKYKLNLNSNRTAADYIKQCKIADKNFVNCSTQSIQQLFDKLNDGESHIAPNGPELTVIIPYPYHPTPTHCVLQAFRV